MTDPEPIACLGAGRMGCGIAVVWAYAGHPVKLVDFKERSEDDFRTLKAGALNGIRGVLSNLSGFGMFDAARIDTIMSRVGIVSRQEAKDALSSAALIIEALPEVLDIKRGALASASALAGPSPIIASTTSTILVDDLSSAVSQPERFLNAHWLNPAYLMPLVEMSPGKKTDPAVTARLKKMLETIGKMPVICAASPGYIVPRIQTLAMNEAARLVEQGVASAEDIDKATKYGLGFRFAVLGVLEFIDWGGGDTLFYASRDLARELNSPCYASPDIIDSNMAQGRIGLKTKRGFLDYEGMDINAYRDERLKAFVAMLRHLDLVKPPVV
ncbi:3-hydroxybutyryl-CoA dehydrogenase [Brucella sp. IR073]|uniref:3-hydroxybutyryl-CoA dehydrogenase n=1 Tax=unclassified Brucella TaxID=2632610 RepID=UPI003B9808E1